MDDHAAVAEDQQSQRERAAKCWEEIQAALAKHRCRLAPILGELEPIGTDGRRAMISASFGVIPQP